MCLQSVCKSLRWCKIYHMFFYRAQEWRRRCGSNTLWLYRGYVHTSVLTTVNSFYSVILILFPLLHLAYQFWAGMLRVSAFLFFVLLEKQLHLSVLSPQGKIFPHPQHEESRSWPELFPHAHVNTHPFPVQLSPAILLSNSISRKWLSVLTCHMGATSSGILSREHDEQGRGRKQLQDAVWSWGGLNRAGSWQSSQRFPTAAFKTPVYPTNQ